MANRVDFFPVIRRVLNFSKRTSPSCLGCIGSDNCKIGFGDHVHLSCAGEAILLASAKVINPQTVYIAAGHTVTSRNENTRVDNAETGSDVFTVAARRDAVQRTDGRD